MLGVVLIGPTPTKCLTLMVLFTFVPVASDHPIADEQVNRPGEAGEILHARKQRTTRIEEISYNI